MLSMSRSWFIGLSNANVLHDAEPPIINILHGWSGTYGQFGLSFLGFLL